MPETVDRRRAISARLTEGETTLVETFLASLAREIPAYASLDERQLQEVRSIIVWTLHRVLDLWAQDGALTEDDIRLFRGVGAVRARDGRPLSAVLRAYRVAATTFLDEVAGRFREDVSVDDVTSLVRVWFAALDELSDAIYDGYESTGRVLGSDRESSLRQLLTDLLLGRQSHAGTLTARLRELEAELPTSFDLVVIGACDDPVQAAAAVAGVRESDEGPLITSIHTVMDGVGVVLLAHADPAALAEQLSRLGLRAAHHGGVTPRTAPRAHRLALHAVGHAPGFAWAGPLLGAGDLEVVALASGHPDADPVRAARIVLGRLADDAEALRTLDAVLQSGGAAPAAAHLHVHPQTIRYRLGRIATVTGRDPRDPWNRYVFQTALMASGLVSQEDG
ncbi:PucR family transcriptional regulator [Aeromicrobium choanae]|uniref:Transcriptional regulator, CdaR family n=1 Tax=Aeromicrobium choanae TaxID=1736691 RepID=A0A1T4YZN6_9ACTN|nr:helix-turn-helix domain-containing protein [Aeromicrobium choanae]SKB07234.1 transcriptional regulator, CdaR family [Aeromicrobium choanae]